MQVWVLQGGQGGDAGGLDAALRGWAGRPGHGLWQVEIHPADGTLAAAVRARRPEVLVLAEAVCPAGPWAEEVLALGTGLVAAVLPVRIEGYRDLAERHPVVLVPAVPTAEDLGLGVLSAHAALRREAHWKVQLDQVQQRLNDRIVIERAKGVLVQRLGIAEEEAYRRLRVLSRRQRRQIRDIAQSLLDAQALLPPEADRMGEEFHANGHNGSGSGLSS